VTGTSLKVEQLPIAEAVKTGTLMRHVAGLVPQVFSAWMVANILRVKERVAAKTTITTDEEAKEIAREIYRQFPTLRIEEMQDVFDGIVFGRYGKYYERLKAAEFIDAFRQHEASEERLRVFETAHKVERYDVVIRSGKQWEAVFTEIARRGWKLRTDKCKDMKLDECYINVEGNAYDIATTPHTGVIMSAKQFAAPIVYKYTKEGVRPDSSKLSANLRRELTVDPKVMAEYINQEQQPLTAPTGNKQ
jgi:hypothetical protein